MARAIKLINAPAGLFDIDGVLVLKTEYSTQHEDGAITPDCYIVDSGEYFWGGVDSVEERNNLEVAPVDMPTLTPPNEPLMLEQLREMNGDPVWVEGIKRWAIVKLNCKGVFLHTTSGEFEVDPLGRDKIYRRPPEGEA